MAAASKSTTAPPLGIQSGPETSVLVASTNIDVDSTIDFEVIGPAEAVEVVIVSATTKTGTPSVVFTLQLHDEGSNTYLDVVASTALTDAGNRFLVCNPNVAAVANISGARVVRPKMRLKIDYTGTPVTDVLNGVTVTAAAQ